VVLVCWWCRFDCSFLHIL